MSCDAKVKEAGEEEPQKARWSKRQEKYIRLYKACLIVRTWSGSDGEVWFANSVYNAGDGRGVGVFQPSEAGGG